MIKKILNNHSNCYFISPHLDDAVFSSGGLISAISKHVQVKVINVFTSAGKAQNTLSSRAYLNQIGFSDTAKLFNLRIIEDSKAMKYLNTKVENWNEVDALWRTKKIALLNSNKFFVPELTRVYATYRYHIVKGKISINDTELLKRLTTKIKSLLKNENDFFFCPAGFGNHVDHNIVREACIQAIPADQLIFWSDFPYIVRPNADTALTKKYILTKINLKIDASKKLQACKIYKTQFNKVIGDETSISDIETYYSICNSKLNPKDTQQGTISGYRFYKFFNKNKNDGQYILSIYKNNSGKKAFLKFLSSPFFSRSKQELDNEVKTLNTINGSKEIHRNSTVLTPKVISSKIEKSKTFLLTEFIEGTSLEVLDAAQKVKAFSIIIDFLSNHTTKFLKVNISRRTKPRLLFLSFCYYFSTLIKLPKYFSQLTSGFVSLLSNYQSNEVLGFVHRDLNSKNIIVDKEKLAIIDFQHATLSSPFFDSVVILMYSWDCPNLAQEIIDQIIKPKIKSLSDFQNFKFICLYVALCELSIQNAMSIGTSLRFLNFADKLKMSDLQV